MLQVDTLMFKILAKYRFSYAQGQLPLIYIFGFEHTSNNQLNYEISSTHRNSEEKFATMSNENGLPPLINIL